MRSLATYKKIVVFGYKHICALYLTLAVFSNIALLLDYKDGTVFAPYFDAIILLLFIPLALGNIDKWIPFIKTGFFAFCCVLTAVYIFNFLRLKYGGYYWVGDEMIDEINRMQRVVLWPVIGFMVYVIETRFFKTGFYILLLVMPSITLMDFFKPSILEAPGEMLTARAQGAYLNANAAGEAAILLGIINLHRFKGMLGVALFVLVALGVLVTFSRSGLAALILFYAYLFVRNKVPKISIIAPIVLALSFSSFIIYAEDVLLSLGYDRSVTNVINRLSFFESVDTDKITADNSGASRAEVAAIAFEQALARPISGYVQDAEAVYDMNPHNEPLYLWYKFGIVGLLAWITMLVVLWRNGSRAGILLLNPGFFVFFWFSFFSHNLFELRYWIVALAFLSLKPVREWHGSLKFLGHNIAQPKTSSSGKTSRRKRRSSIAGSDSNVGHGSKRRRRRRPKHV